MSQRQDKIQEIVRQSAQSLSALTAEHVAVMDRMAGRLIDAFTAGHKLLLCGNGGSAADAQHIACELTGHFLHDRAALPAMALSTDTSVLTAVANDYSYEKIFSRGVEALGRHGDVLWALSTSGNSANVLAAAEAARARGMSVLGMTGEAGGKLAGLCDICFQAPAQMHFLVQQVHQVAYHAICAILDEHFAGKA